MKNEYFYDVNGSEFHDDECFGKAWHDAMEMAKAEHAVIWRSVVKPNGDISYEFYAHGCFLNERYYEPRKAYIF